jgi:hypothetical protein
MEDVTAKELIYVCHLTMHGVANYWKVISDDAEDYPKFIPKHQSHRDCFEAVGRTKVEALENVQAFKAEWFLKIV